MVSPEAETGPQQAKAVPLTEDPSKEFIDILNNRGIDDPAASDSRMRQHGFVVLARDGVDLWPLQALCGERHQKYNDCMTVRYRLRSGAIFGTLLAAFMRDIQNIGSRRTDDLAGIFVPGAADAAWQNFVHGGRTGPDSLTLVQELDRLAIEQPESDLDEKRLDALMRLLGSEEVLHRGERLILFAEVDDDGTDANEDEWELARTILFDRLPERVGLVFLGAPDGFRLGDDPHFLELSLSGLTISDPPPAIDPRFSFKQGSLLSDLPAKRDTLGVKNDAEALARFVLHSQTDPPLTIGIHGPWGKGKSSFMRLVEDALLNKALSDLSKEDSQPINELSRLQGEIFEIEQQLEQAAETEVPQLRVRQLAKGAEYEEKRKHLVEPKVITVQFNAWQFEDAKQIWAGLASVISERLERALPWYQHLGMRFRYAWKERRSDLVLNVALPLLLALAILLYLAFGGYEQFAASLKGAGAQDLVLRAVLAALLPFGSLLFLIWFTSKQMLSVIQPLSQRVLSYIELPTYREQMGYQHRVMEDLRFVYGCLRQHHSRRHRGSESKVVVFIDDLDRCSEDKIMEVLQAITLILGDSRFFVFLGMDTEMIYRAVRTHYASDQTENELPADFPEEYLHKVIQISFYLPGTSERSRLAYIDSLFSESSRRARELPAVGHLPVSDTNGHQTTRPAANGSLPVNFSFIRQPSPKEVVDTRTELATFRKHVEFLEDNPRAVKRLINLHRLVKIVLTVKEQQLLSREANQCKLVRWLIFCAAWPEFIDDCFAERKSSPESQNILASLVKKLKDERPDQVKKEQSDQASDSPPSLKSLEKFATFDERGVLSAQDIDDLMLAAQISRLIRGSVAQQGAASASEHDVNSMPSSGTEASTTS